ncbi:MAG: class I SAM-dependent methyltransferase [Crocinitomicaceae bacterium]
MTKMEAIESIRGLDLYLLDQILKGRLHTGMTILDAGCGTGRNIVVLKKMGFDITGFDSNNETIEELKHNHPSLVKDISCNSIEDFAMNNLYDYIIVNAVFHFAESHQHFENMFNKLSKILKPNGQLFIRMTSNIAIEKSFITQENGTAYLPDDSYRYLLEFERLIKLMTKNELQWVEPIKTVNVADLRCMSTVILQKIST